MTLVLVAKVSGYFFFLLVPAFFLNVMIQLVRCPKCGHVVVRTLRGWVSPFPPKACRRCGTSLQAED